MPFATFPNAQLPAPTVEMLFKGLIIIKPNTNNTCSIWIHTEPDDHFLILEIRGKSTAKGDFLVKRHTGPIASPPLTVSFDQGAAGVSAFKPESRPFDRERARERRDIGWTIDLEHSEFHGIPLRVNSAVAAGIEMSQGIFFTADATDERDLDVARKRGADIRKLRQISTIVCANLAPPSGRKVVLNRRDVAGWPVTLPRADDGQDARYRISVRNDPLAIDFEPTHDELERYYDLVRTSGGLQIPTLDRFSLDVRPRLSGPVASDEIPCMPILLGG